jgi:hypothetical protein
MKRNAMLVAVALAFASGAALAQSAPPAGADRSPRMHLDADGDNRISREEAANHPRLAAEFDRIDTDRDGFLSRNEMRAAHGARGKGRSKLDVNGDGYISRDEASSAPRLAQQFDQLDTDKDGLLSQAEMRAGWEARRGERGFGPHHGQGPNHAQGPHHARGRTTHGARTSMSTAMATSRAKKHKGHRDSPSDSTRSIPIKTACCRATS